ncbi:MAG: GNAT family N-acetyltransferase [Prevotella sp.]|nr:GNAT family N-acetyltransferase [Prevotella sp.]
MKQTNVTLRAMEPEDLELLYRIENDTTLWNVGATNVPYSRYALHDFIANSSSDIYRDRQVRLMIDNDEHETIGIVDVVNFDPQHIRAEIGIVILGAYRNKGYGIRTLSQIEDYARNVLHLHQIYAIIGASNAVSIRLFNSLHYEQSARLRDWLFDGKTFHDALLVQKLL